MLQLHLGDQQSIKVFLISEVLQYSYLHQQRRKKINNMHWYYGFETSTRIFTNNVGKKLTICIDTMALKRKYLKSIRSMVVWFGTKQASRYQYL